MNIATAAGGAVTPSGRWRLAARALWRERRLGSLRLLALATVIAVAALTSVGFFADRVRQALNQQAHLLLGADLRVVSPRPWEPALRELILAEGLQLAETVNFPSMVGTDAGFQLADVKAVSAGYPLRGALRIAAARNAPDAVTRAVPKPGEAWIDERLASALDLDAGATLQLGRASLRVAAILTLEPDRGMNFFALSPRVMVNLADLDRSGLIQAGSRIRYRLLAAGEAAAVERLERVLEARLGSGQRLESAANARPEIRNALDRAERFLGLAAVLAVVLSTVAIALAIRRYLQAAYDGLAVMRCLGATQGLLAGLLLRQFLLLATLATLVGLLLGYAAHAVLALFLARFLAIALPLPGMQPALVGLLLGPLLVLSLIVPRLLQLRALPSLRVIRRELGPPLQSVWLAYGLAGLLLLALMAVVAADWRLALWLAGGFLAAAGFFFGLAYLIVVGLRSLRRRATLAGGIGWAIAAIGKRPVAVAVQTAGLGIGVMALLLLTVIQHELIAAWEKAAPPDAPNRFVINIQPDQVDGVEAILGDAGIAVRLEPMIRGRLVGIGERAIAPEDFEDERARRLTEREFNLSWRGDLPEGNAVVAGRWFAAAEPEPAASVEEGLAKTLGIRVGDRLRFDLAGTPVAVKVVGLRRLKWESMRVNFFVIFSPGSLDGFPASHIVSYHQRADQSDLNQRLLRAYPNLTVIDVGAMLTQVRGITEQVTAAVRFLFVFSILAGLTVLYGTFAIAFDERRHEVAVMRALGATRAQLARSVRLEFGAIGAFAGLIAAFGALLVGWVVARQVFSIALTPSWWLLPAAATLGSLAVMLLGRGALGSLLAAPPMQSLRHAE